MNNKHTTVTSTKRGSVFSKDIASSIEQWLKGHGRSDAAELHADILYALIINISASILSAAIPDKALESSVNNIEMIVTGTTSNKRIH